MVQLFIPFQWYREMLVQWVTKNSSKPTVKWGMTPGVYDSSTGANTMTYRRDELCGGAATGVGVWIWFCVMYRSDVFLWG